MHRPTIQDNVSQYFGENRDPYYASIGLLGHEGIDIPCPVGSPVVAAHHGVVHEVIEANPGISGTRGQGVRLRSKDPAGGRYFVTEYWHISEFKVKEGQEVKEGELIALSGNTGNSTGPHVHFGLKFYDLNLNIINPKNGYAGCVNPQPYIMKVNADELRSLYNMVFGRDPDQAAWGYVDQDLSFILNEFSKSKEYQADASVLAAIRTKFNVIV